MITAAVLLLFLGVGWLVLAESFRYSRPDKHK
jgi:hypothetical protein